VDKETEDFIRVVETWQFQRHEVFKREEFDSGRNAASLRQFVETNNRLSRRLISLLDKRDPAFWSALQELAVVAGTIVSGGKTFVNGQDRTSEGM
jgi:BMFP domain-containing protein YqiC